MKCISELLHDALSLSNAIHCGGDHNCDSENQFSLLSDLQYGEPDEILEQLALPNRGVVML